MLVSRYAKKKKKQFVFLSCIYSINGSLISLVVTCKFLDRFRKNADLDTISRKRIFRNFYTILAYVILRINNIYIKIRYSLIFNKYNKEKENFYKNIDLNRAIVI